MDQLNKYIEPLQFKALDKMQSLKFIEEKYKVKMQRCKVGRPTFPLLRVKQF